MAAENAFSSKDLPIFANSQDIQVSHFLLDLMCNIRENVFVGSITLFLKQCTDGYIFDVKHYQPKSIDGTSSNVIKPVATKNINSVVPYKKCEHSNVSKSFNLVLDSHSLTVNSVVEILEDKSSSVHELLHLRESSSEKELNFAVDEWSIRIWKTGVYDAKSFPAIVRIFYATKPNGKSLRWCTDQDGNKCVFTAGMWVNNRAFMPCQEYGSLSTWNASITVPADYTVLMSGDKTMVLEHAENVMNEYRFCCSTPLPSFTLAVAVGKLSHFAQRVPTSAETIEQTTCNHCPACAIPFATQNQLPWRIFAPSSLLDKARKEFGEYLPKCLAVIQELFGPSPFPRLDVMIYPAYSQDMAMTNPNLIFLSQSMLAGDGSMCIKLAHELSHYWFGLLIGARDWTEEWLSEGFATFAEDLIHARVMRWTEEELREHSELRASLRYSTLIAELRNTQEELRYLRPNQGKDRQKDGESVMFVKNGMNPRKQFTQLHYLKGYFLLRFLAEKVGFERFGGVLHEYIKRYHGSMVHSQDFVKLVFENFPELKACGITENVIYEEWLDNSEIPGYLQNFRVSRTNKLYNVVLEEVQKWDNMVCEHKRKQKRRRKKARLSWEGSFQKLYADQLVCLLEKLLQHSSVPNSVLCHIHKTYQISSANADVRHRWCEMVVKYKYEKHYDDVNRFLINDQAMGVYLYGELIISRDRKQRQLAEACFQKVQAEMEEGTRRTVHVMIYGDDGQGQLMCDPKWIGSKVDNQNNSERTSH